MNLKEEIEKLSSEHDDYNYRIGVLYIESNDALRIAEKYANFKMKLILGHFQRKCDNIEQSLNTFDKNEQLTTEVKNESV